MKSSKKTTKTDLYILFGSPGAGKSTQALLLQNSLGFQYISWGQISREMKTGQGDYKKRSDLLKKIMAQTDQPFPKGFIAGIICEEITKLIKRNPEIKGIILDGFPRRIEEAKELEAIIKITDLNLKSLIKFNVNFNTIKNRISDREYCPKCGKFYNKIISPKKRGRCDTEGEPLIKRKDDNPESLKLRFDAYIEESIDAFKFLSTKAESLLNVDADQQEIDLFAEILTKLNKNPQDLPPKKLTLGRRTRISESYF